MATRVKADGTRISSSGAVISGPKTSSTPKTGGSYTAPTSPSINDSIAAINAATSKLGAQYGTSFTQLKPLEITSSTSVQNKKNQQDKMNQAGNALTTPSGRPQTPATGPTEFEQLYGSMGAQGVSMMNAQFGDMMGMYRAQMKALDMTYNASLAAVNYQYDTLFSELKDSYSKQMEVANYNAQALNPYSTAAGAQTAANFTNEITNRYQKQSTQLARQADLAQQQLAAGQYEAYISLQNNMKTQTMQFQQQMLGFMMDTTKSINEARQFEQQEKRANVNNYIDFLSQQLPTPQEVEAMTDQQLLALPAVQQGLRAGYDIQGIREDLLNASNMQAQQLAWETEDRALDKQIKEAQLAKIWSDMSTAGSGGDTPTWNEYITERQAQEGQTFSASRIEQERQIYRTLFDEDGPKVYDEKTVPPVIKEEIIEVVDYANKNGIDLPFSEIAKRYSSVTPEGLQAILDSASYGSPRKKDEPGWFSLLTKVVGNSAADAAQNTYSVTNPSSMITR